MYDEQNYKKIIETVEYEITLFESFYHCLSSNFSEAYLQGSDWYVGPSLRDWWLKVEGCTLNYEKKFDKFQYIKEILLSWMIEIKT